MKLTVHIYFTDGSKVIEDCDSFEMNVREDYLDLYTNAKEDEPYVGMSFEAKLITSIAITNKGELTWPTRQ